MDVVHADGRGERTDISPRTFTVKRVDGREWAKTSQGKDKDGRRVDEKRWGWLPNSNLGVGRVGKWAQCGVTLRAFALSPSQPLLLSLPRTRDSSSASVPLAFPLSPPWYAARSTFRTLTPLLHPPAQAPR